MKKIVIVLLLCCSGQLSCQKILLDIGAQPIDTTFTFMDTIQRYKTVVRVLADGKARAGSRPYSTIFKTVYDSTGYLLFEEISKGALERIYLKQTKYSPDGSYKTAIRKRKASHTVTWYDKNGKKLKTITCKDMQKDCDNDPWEQALPYTYWYL